MATGKPPFAGAAMSAFEMFSERDLEASTRLVFLRSSLMYALKMAETAVLRKRDASASYMDA